MHPYSSITALALGAWSMAHSGLACAEEAPNEKLARQMVQIDIALAACSTRLEVDGFRFNRAQTQWRNILVNEGAMAQQLYKRIYDKEMIEVLRVMANDEKRACPHAFARVKEVMANDAPFVALEPQK